MYGSITTYDMPVLNTYEKALAHYESIKPIRGKDWLRPIINTLNGRRRQHMQIIKHRDETIACRLYDTDVLTYFPDGEIHFTSGGYPTTSTHQFASAILSGYLTCNGFKGDTQVAVASGYTVVRGTDVLRMRVEPNGVPQGALTLIDPPTLYAYYLKRPEMNRRRKEIKPFIKYVSALAKIVDPEDYKENWRHLNANHLHSLVTSDDEEKHAAAAEWLLHRTCRYRGNWLDRELSVHPKDITKILDDMLKYMYAKDLFEKRVVNKPQTNDNEKYLQGEMAWL